MSGHGADCWRDPAHHVCAVAAAARAEGERDEARRATDDAYQRLAGHEALLIETTVTAAVSGQALERVEALLGEYRMDLETKGEAWRPPFRAAVELVVTQLGQALGHVVRAGGGGDGAAAAGQRQ